MTNGIFKRTGGFGATRATNIMSTQSTSDFEWSVKLICKGFPGFYVGIASIFKLENAYIENYDETAILYFSKYTSFINYRFPKIISRKKTVYSNLPSLFNGDVIRFRFQPQAKKLIIKLVRI